MSDQVTGCFKKMDGEVVIQYDFNYEVENGASKNQFCVTVLGSDMTDPADAAEAKTKANVKAKAIKDAWVADLPDYSATAVESVVGDVTLT